MTRIILLLSCGHWVMSMPIMTGEPCLCRLCPKGSAPVTVVGQASPHQLVMAGSNGKAG